MVSTHVDVHGACSLLLKGIVVWLIPAVNISCQKCLWNIVHCLVIHVRTYFPCCLLVYLLLRINLARSDKNPFTSDTLLPKNTVVKTLYYMYHVCDVAVMLHVLVYLFLASLSCMPLCVEFGIIGGLITMAFSLTLSLSCIPGFDSTS